MNYFKRDMKQLQEATTYPQDERSYKDGGIYLAKESNDLIEKYIYDKTDTVKLSNQKIIVF